MEKNISDNLKYFPDKPKRVKFWEMKKEFNLALFVVIKDYPLEITEKIEDLQDEIINQLPEDTNFLYDIDKIEKEGLEEDGLYVYPPEDFHFTLINFLKYSVGFKYMPRVDSEELKNSVVGYKDYVEMKSEIQKVIKGSTLHQTKADLRWIYSGKNGEIDSISLQVFPEEGFIDQLKKIEEETKKYTDKLPWPNLRVKANPKCCPVAFTMNILRFIKNTKDKESKLPKGDAEKIINCIGEINKKHNKEPLDKINIKKIILHEVNNAFFHKPDVGLPFNLR